MRERENEKCPKELQRRSLGVQQVVLETSHSSVVAIADHKKDFDSSLDSLETDCTRLRSSNSFETGESGEYQVSSINYENSEIIESPESPVEQPKEDDMNNFTNSGIFIVESHRQPSQQSVTNVVLANYLEQVAREDANSYFVTPQGPLRRVNLQPASPVNNLEAIRTVKKTSTKSRAENNCDYIPHHPFQFRQPGRAARLMTVALSQSAPGLESICKRVGYGRGHGCTAKLAKRYFGF